MLGVAACLLLGAAPGAHHSISANYDDSRRTKVEGVVAEFQFVNPHPLVGLDVADEDGSIRRWRLEMDNRLELVQIGFARDTLKPGDALVVVGSPARGEALGLYIRRLDRPADGFWYEQVGASPRSGTRSVRNSPPR